MSALLNSGGIQEMRTRYLALDRRDRLALNGLGVFLAVMIFYFGVWSPVQDYLAASREDHQHQQALLGYLMSTEDQARAASGTGSTAPATGQNLLTAVSRAAQGVDIKPSRMQPEGSDAVSVWFEAVPFTRLMLWLERLESSQGIVVRQISVDRRDEPGQVAARVVLRN